MMWKWVVIALFVVGCGSVSSTPDAKVVQPDTPSIDTPEGCGPTTCASGCCDAAGMCRAAPACGTQGAACVAGCPLTQPEASDMLVWLVGEDYDAAAATKTWPDRSGNGADATCMTPLTCPMNATINGKRDVMFTGGMEGFKLTETSMAFKTQSWTFFIVAKPSTTAAAYSHLFGFYASNNYVKVQRDNTSANFAFQIIPGTGTNYIVSGASWGWSGQWERIMASVDGTGSAKLGVYNTPSAISSLVSGVVGAPTDVDYTAGYIGTRPENPGSTAFVGEIAEVIIFDAQISDATHTAIQSYLTARYGF